LEEKFGPFSINRLATCENKKCVRYYARSFEEGTCGTDGFAQAWQGECIYAAPLSPL
jgi:hypothetical protein